MNKRNYRLIKYFISTLALTTISIAILTLFYFKSEDTTPILVETLVGSCIGGIIANFYWNKKEAQAEKETKKEVQAEKETKKEVKINI